MGKFIITHDVFNIAKRLKQIDKKYFIVFNSVNGKFEIHFKRQAGTLELILPYNSLDERTIVHVLKTKIERSSELLKEMEEQNILLQKKAEKNLLEEIGLKTEKMLNNIAEK